MCFGLSINSNRYRKTSIDWSLQSQCESAGGINLTSEPTEISMAFPTPLKRAM